MRPLLLSICLLAAPACVCAQTITTSPLSSSYCAGSALSVSFTISPVISASTTYTAQLSSATGSFSAPVAIGTLTGSSLSSGTVNATLPSSTAAGSGYRIRVRASGATTSDNGSDIAIRANADINSPSNKFVCKGSSTSMTFSGGASNSYYKWTNSNTAIGLAANGTGNIASFSTTNSANTSAIAGTISVQAISGEMAYITNAADDNVSVINTATNTVVATIAVGNSPRGATLSLDGSRLYVSNFSDGTVSMINTATNLVLSTITVGSGPRSLAVTPNGSTLYVGNENSNNVSVVNTATHAVTATITVGSTPRGLAALPDGSAIYVSNSGSNTVSVISTASNTVVSTITVGTGPSGIASNSSGTRVYVANNGSDDIAVINTSNNTATGAVTVGDQPFGIAVGGGNVYVGNFGDNTVKVISTSTLAVIATVAVGTGPRGVALSDDQDHVYIANNTSNNVSVLSTASNTIVATVSVGNGPYSMGTFLAPRSCTSNAQTATITVIPIPTVNTVANQVLCADTEIEPVNFTGTVVGTSYNWTNNNEATGLPVSGIGDIEAVYLLNDGTTALTSTITVTPVVTNGGVGCSGSVKTFTLTANAIPTMTQPAHVAYCHGNSSTAVTFSSSTPNTSFTWTNDNTSIGLAATGSGSVPVFNATNVSNTPIVATVDITPSVLSGGITCQGASKSYEIYVSPVPTATIAYGASSYCPLGTSAVLQTGTTGGQYSSSPSGLSLDPDGGTIDLSGSNAGTYTVTYTVTDSCAIFTTSTQVTIKPVPDIYTPSQLFVCTDASITPPAFAGTYGGTTFTWTNNNTASGLASSGTGNIAAFTTTNSGASQVSSTVAVTPALDGCIGDTKSFVIVVNPKAIVNARPNIILCPDATQATILFSSATTGATVLWTNSLPAIGAASSGTQSIPSFVATNSSTGQYVASVTAQASYSAGGASCAGPATSFTITVNPKPSVAPISNTVLCAGSSYTELVSGPVNGTSYPWTNNNTATGLSASGSGNVGPFVLAAGGASAEQSVITITPIVTISGKTCVGSSSIYTLLVSPKPSVNSVGDQTLCATSSTNSVAFSGTANALFNWTNSNSGIGLATSGTGTIASFPAVNNGSSNQVATIVVTPSITQNGITCNGNNTGFTYVIKPNPQLALVPAQSVCAGIETTPFIFNSTIGGTSVAWTNNNTSIGLAASGSGNIAAFTASNNGNTIQSATILATPFYNGCNGTAISSTITVNPVPSGSFSYSGTPYCTNSPIALPTGTITPGGSFTSSTGLQINSSSGAIDNSTSTPGTYTVTYTVSSSASGGCALYSVSTVVTIRQAPPNGSTPLQQTLCAGAATTPIVFSGGNPGDTYSWINDNSSVGLAASGNSSSIPSFTSSNNSNTVQSASILLPAVANGCRPSPSVITVLPQPTLSVIANKTLCAGGPQAAITFTSPVNGAFFQWTNNNTSIGLAASGTGTIPAFTGTNASGSTQIATITATAGYLYNGVTCLGATRTFTITVYAAPTMNQPASQAICAGSIQGATSFSGSSASNIYAWTNSNTSIGIGSFGLGSIPAYTASNASETTRTATITVVPYFSNGGLSCGGASKTFTVTVLPIPRVDSVADRTLCANTAFAALTFTSPVSGTQYSWTTNNTSSGLPGSGTNSISTVTVSNGSDTTKTSVVQVVPTAAGCVGSTRTFTVRVRPMPYLNAISSTRLCAGSSAAFPLTGLRDSVAWTNSNPLIGLASAGFGAIPSFVLENSDTISRAGTLSALPWILGCPGTAAGFTVTVNPKPVLSAPGNVVTCNSKSTTITPFSANMIASTYTWTGSIASIGLASSGTGQIPTFTAQNNTMAALTDTIRATPSVIVGGLSCAGSAGLFTIKVNAASSGTFSYAGSPYCANTGNASFTGTLGGGGVFSAGAGLSINSSTGVINLGTSIEGDYTVTYSVTAANSGGCNALSTSADVRVKRNPLVVAPSNVVLCSGDALNVNFGQDSANNLDRSYTWAANSNVAGIGPSGTGNMSGIAVTNAGSSTIIDTITVQGTNGGLVYVSQANGQLLTLNPTTLTKTVILSTADSGRGLWASRGGQYLYLAHGTKVSAINMATGALSYNYQGSMSMNMIFETPGRRSLYLGYNNAYSNSQIEKVLAPIFAFKRLSTASKPVYGMAMATDTNKLYSTFIGGPSIRIVNNTTRSNEYVITRSYPFDLAISNTKNRLYISHSTLPAISVLNTVTNMIVDTIPLPGNGSQLLMNADGSRLYVAMPNLNSIAVVRSSDSSLLTTIALGAQPSSMALSSDGASLFVTTTVSPYTFFEVSTVTNTVTRTTTTGLPGFFHAVTVSPGCTNPTATFTITVKPTPSGSFQYSSSPYCRNAGLATTTGTLTSGGIYTAAAGLSINDSTGTVNLAASTPGTYTVEYTMAASGACATFTTSAMITIKEVPVMVHTATQAICSGGISADVSFSSSMINSSFAWTGSTALAGLLSSGNGNIPSFTTTNNTAAVLVDTILVRATNDGCQGAADTIYFRVTPLPLATIAYDAQQFCAQGSAQVSRTGTAGGVYSSSTGLSIDASTGAVNLATSTAGTYTVTYTVGASGGCSLFATTTSITINAYSTWTGAADRNWSNAANWCGVLPTSSTDVLVPVVPNQPIVYTTATVRNLTVQTGTSLMVQGSLSLYGNLANSGGSIDMSMGTLNLEGSQLQQVPAFAATNVNVKGGGGFTLAGSSTVSGTLSFSASGGFITLGSYNLSAGTITGGSATGFVVTNGTGRLTVRSVGIATTVPIGVASNSFSPLVVNSPEGLDWSVRVQPDFSGYTAINSGFALPRVWVVTPTQTPTLLPAQITFTYPNSVWATPATVNVFHYGAATGWQLSGSNGAALSSTLNGNLRSVVLSRQQQFSPFAIGGAGVDLPVTLLGFTGQRLRDRNHLKWITATEVNSLGFDVERSMDGRRFLALEFVASASIDGNSSTQLPYSYVDASALQQSYYYRLKLIDRDGRYRFSPVLHLQTGKEEGLRITQLYPNPARQSTSVQLSSPVGYDLQVTLLDANGQLARLKNISVGPGASVFTLPLDGLAAGVYLLQVSGPAGVKSEVLKVFKE